MRISVGVLVVALLVIWTSTADAQRRRRGNRGQDFVTQDTFGLGLMLGGPTGLNGKYYLGADTALDFGIGAHRFGRFDNALQIHVDYLWHPVNLVEHDAFDLPLYFGIGGRLLAFGDRDRNDNFDDDDVHLGVRGPIGIAMIFNEVPIDIFFEIALVVDIIVEGRDDDVLFADLNALIGFRYYFY